MSSYDDLENESSSTDNVTFLFLMAMVFSVLIILLAYSYEYTRLIKISRLLPNASANILLGMIVGGFMSLRRDLQDSFSFDGEFFFLVMLPPIIFASGFNLRKDYFFYNLGTILLYAFVGTAIATGVIAWLLKWLSPWTYELTLNECLIFASLISAIDPVATIVTMQAAGVGGRLFALIFGEAVLNDAVAIVIEEVFLDVAEDNKDILTELGIAVPRILLISIASVLIGVIIALGSAFLFKKANFGSNVVLEVTLFLILGLLPYMICGLHKALSGIMAILFSGIFFDYYTYYHLTIEGQTTVKIIIHMLEFLSEGFVFFFLGTALWRSNNKWSGGLFFLTIASCIIGRALSVFPLTWIINMIGRKHPITKQESVMLWFSGLRGPVCFALAFKISSKAVPEDDSRNTIISTTLLIIWVTTFLMGGMSDWTLRLLGLVVKKPEVSMIESNEDPDYLLVEPPKIERSFLQSNHWFRKLNSKYLTKPFGSQSKIFTIRHGIELSSISSFEKTIGSDEEDGKMEILSPHRRSAFDGHSSPQNNSILEEPEQKHPPRIQIDKPSLAIGREKKGIDYFKSKLRGVARKDEALLADHLGSAETQASYNMDRIR